MLKLSQIAGMGLIYKLFSLDYFLDDLVKIGFESVELWGAYPQQFVDGRQSFPSCGEVRRKIQERGLHLVCYTPEQLLYYYNIASRDRVMRERSIAYYQRAIYAACELGTDRMLMTSGWGLLDENREDAWKYSCESLQILADYAGRLGVTLVLENLQAEESNLVNSLPTLKKMLSDIGSPVFKAMVDTVAMHCQGESMQQYLDTFGDDLVHVHMVDGTPSGHLAWGKGELPLDEDAQALCDYGYQNAITFEVAEGDLFHPGDEMAVSFARVQKYIV